MIRNKLSLVIAYLFLVLVTVACTNTEDKEESKLITEADSLELRHIKEVLWPKAYREQDTILLDNILDESFELIDLEGNRSTKQDEIDWIKDHAMQHDSFAYEIKRLDIYENGTAIVAGTGHIRNDSTYNIYQSSNVLIKRDTIWKAVLSHVSGYRTIE